VTRNREIKRSRDVDGIDQFQVVLNVLYKSYLDLHQIINFKAFIDKTWHDLWEYYFNLSDVFKNICEKNNQNGKNIFHDFSLAVRVDAEVEDNASGAGS
jgi:hypothetical protein